MIDIIDRLRFDAVRCEMQFSKGVAGNIEEAAKEIERLRAALQRIAKQETQDETDKDSSEVRWEEGFDALVMIARDALNQQ